VSALQQIGKEEDADAVKSWLRSQHAKTIRERKRGAQPRDFDLIGTEFHRWVRDHEDSLGLTSSTAFVSFIEGDFTFYSSQYEKIRRAGADLTDGLESVYYNAQNNFTLQYPAILASLNRSDSEHDVYRKIRMVASYLDIMIARRIWNWKATDYSTMQYAMFQFIILGVRGKTVQEIADILVSRLNAEDQLFSTNDRFYLHGMNGRQIHYLLARMTDYIETRSGHASRYKEYMHRHGKNGYEVEHIWANHPENHKDEFKHPADFAEYRNRIGGLLLLPKSFNASYGDDPYNTKREHYNIHNLLARSLHERAYDHNPGFLRFCDESGLLFRPHTEFKKADQDERQKLYQSLAEQVWSVSRISDELKT
jgi:hypothetical protein